MCSVFFYISPSGNQGLLFSPPPVSGSLEIEECKSAIMMEGEGLVYFYLIASRCVYGPACAGFKCHKLSAYFEGLDIPVTQYRTEGAGYLKYRHTSSHAHTSHMYCTHTHIYVFVLYCTCIYPVFFLCAFTSPPL